MREILECPAVLVTMLISVRGLGSAKNIDNILVSNTVNKQHMLLKHDIKRPESIAIDFGSFTG